MSPLELYFEYAHRQSKTSLKNFLEYVIIDSDPPKRLNSVIKDWQKEFYDLLIPLFESAAGLQNSKKRNIFVTASKGLSKTSGLALMVIWLLMYASRRLKIVVAAGSKEQADIFRQRMKAEASHNPFIKLNFQNYKVIGPNGSELDIISADDSLASGRLDDVFILEEITYHKKPDLWQQLMAAKQKRPNAIMAIVSNAGLIGTPEWDLWQKAKTLSSWIVKEIYSEDTWLNKTALEEQKILLPPGLYRRLIKNQWINASEENGYITREEISACIDESWRDQDEGNENNEYIAMIDLGLTGDPTAMVICHLEDDIVVLDKLDLKQGSREAPVKLMDIEAWIDEAIEHFHIRTLILDPWQLKYIKEKYPQLDVVEQSFSLNEHFKLAETFRSLVLNKRFKTYNEPRLIEEIENLIVVIKGNQYRVDHQTGKHNDIYCAISCAALHLVEKQNLLDPATLMISKPTLSEEINMHSEVEYFTSYATYVSKPKLNGKEVMLSDYQSMHHAALAVNIAHELMGEVQPNSIDKKDLPKESVVDAMRADIKKRLEDRNLLPLKKK